MSHKSFCIQANMSLHGRFFPQWRNRHAGVEGSVLHGRNVSRHLLIIKTCTCCIIRMSLFYKISKTKQKAVKKPTQILFLLPIRQCGITQKNLTPQFQLGQVMTHQTFFFTKDCSVLHRTIFLHFEYLSYILYARSRNVPPF